MTTRFPHIAEDPVWGEASDGRFSLEEIRVKSNPHQKNSRNNCKLSQSKLYLSRLYSWIIDLDYNYYRSFHESGFGTNYSNSLSWKVWTLGADSIRLPPFPVRSRREVVIIPLHPILRKIGCPDWVDIHKEPLCLVIIFIAMVLLI